MNRHNAGNAMRVAAYTTSTALFFIAAIVYAIVGTWWVVALFAVLYLAGIWATSNALNKWLTEALTGWSITAIIRHTHKKEQQ